MSASLARPRRAAGLPFILMMLFIDALGVGLMVPLVPSLVRELTGRLPGDASVLTAALVSTFALAQLIFSPVLGSLSDSYGRRPVLILSIAGVAANYLLLAWAPSLPWLFLGRALAGATSANIATANAYIADISTPEQRARRFGTVMAVFSLGFVAGPPLGGLLGDIDLRLPFQISAALAGLNALYGWIVLPESLPPARRQPFAWRGANPVAALEGLAGDPFSRWIAVAWSALFYALGTIQAVFILSNQQRFGWTNAQNGLALGVFGVTGTIVQGLLVRPVIARLGQRIAAQAGLILCAVSYLVMALAPVGWVIFVAIVLGGLGQVANPSLRSLISNHAGPDRQGRTMGALSAVEGMTSIVAPWVAGLVFQLFAAPGFGLHLPGAPFLLVAAFYGLAVLAVRRIPAA